MSYVAAKAGPARGIGDWEDALVKLGLGVGEKIVEQGGEAFQHQMTVEAQQEAQRRQEEQAAKERMTALLADKKLWGIVAVSAAGLFYFMKRGKRRV